MTKAVDALAALGISLEEAVEADERLNQKPRRDNRVCLCGHAMSRHFIGDGVVVCKPSKMDCPCKAGRPVLFAEDTRMFLRKTTGYGVEHALVRGMSALARAGKEAKWIVDLTCDRCQSTEGRILPAPITSGNGIAQEATGRDALLCEKCVGEI